MVKHVSWVIMGLLTGGCCGQLKDQVEQQKAQYAQLSQQYEQEKQGHAAARAELEQSQLKVLQLTEQLKQMGVDMDSLSQEQQKLTMSLDDMKRALEDYKARAAQLERIKKRFVELKEKLDKLTKLGLKVEIRNNRMVIRLPGDVLFRSGEDKLQADGKDVLAAVAAVITKDSDLSRRFYQVAGHTDNKPLMGGRFGDNWGLSVMRARSVLLFLIAPNDGKNGGGGMDQMKLHAAGYGETDPAVANDSDEGRRQNRRVELVVMPSVEEMLDLRNL